MAKDINRHRLAVSCSVVTVFLTAGLTGCGGGSRTDPNPGDIVDYRDYALPTTSGFHEFDHYTLDSNGSTVFLERKVWQFTVLPGYSVLTTDSGESRVLIEDSTLIFDPGTEREFSMLRSVKQGDLLHDFEGNPFEVFGPYKNNTFTLYGAPELKRQDGSVLIEIYRRGQDGFSDVYIRHFAKGLGVVGLNYYEYCPQDVALDINLNYESLCDDPYPGKILVTP